MSPDTSDISIDVDARQRHLDVHRDFQHLVAKHVAVMQCNAEVNARPTKQDGAARHRDQRNPEQHTEDRHGEARRNQKGEVTPRRCSTYQSGQRCELAGLHDNRAAHS